MGIQLAPIEGTPYAGGTATGIIYLDANGLQRSDAATVDASGNVTVGKAFLGEWSAVAGWMTLRQSEQNSLTGYALAQSDAGVTVLNGATNVTVQVGGANAKMVVTSSGVVVNKKLSVNAQAITDTPLTVTGAVGQTADLILANDGSNDVFVVAQNGDVDLDRTGDTAGPSVQLSHWSSKTAKRSTVDFRKSGSNTKGGNTTLSDGTNIGDIWWLGNDGNGFHESARIYGLSAGTTNNNTPGKIRFATTPSGAYTAADRMEIDESGLVSVYDDLAITSPTVPASASATGTAGTISWDSNYVYVCTATDTWKRTALSTW